MSKNRLYFLLFVGCLAGYCWVFYLYLQEAKSMVPGLTVCLFKSVTGIPCPSCGASRSVLALAHGHVTGALALNPLGLFIALVLVLAPLWIVYDLLLGKSSLQNAYKTLEEVLSRKYVAIPAIGLMAANWIWNILKGL